MTIRHRFCSKSSNYCPENLTQLQSFLGKINYYHRYIPNYSQLAAPLNQLRKKDVPFTWFTAQENAFNKLVSYH